MCNVQATPKNIRAVSKIGPMSSLLDVLEVERLVCERFLLGLASFGETFFDSKMGKFSSV